MGYYFHSTGSCFEFKDSLDGEAVKKLADFFKIEDPAHSARLYLTKNWDDMTPLEQMSELLYYDGWQVDDGYIYFEESKDSDADEMWALLGPYVKEDSYIDLIGEDDCTWEYYFDGEKMEIFYGGETFFPKNDDFDAPRANELLKKTIRKLREDGYSDEQIAEMLELSELEKTVLRNIV